MGQLQIPNTSIRYDNPKQVDQTTNISPLTGKVWKASNNDTFTFTYPNGSQGVGSNLGDPQPGSYDPSPAITSPVLFNKQPRSMSDGGVKVPTSSCTWKNPA